MHLIRKINSLRSKRMWMVSYTLAARKKCCFFNSLFRDPAVPEFPEKLPRTVCLLIHQKENLSARLSATTSITPGKHGGSTSRAPWPFLYTNWDISDWHWPRVIQTQQRRCHLDSSPKPWFAPCLFRDISLCKVLVAEKESSAAVRRRERSLKSKVQRNQRAGH